MSDIFQINFCYIIFFACCKKTIYTESDLKIKSSEYSRFLSKATKATFCGVRLHSRLMHYFVLCAFLDSTARKR